MARTVKLLSALRPLVALLVLVSLLPAAPAEAKRQRGDEVEFTGLVTDGLGQPLEGVRVVLEASRNSFRLRSMQREEVDAYRLAAVTDSRGEYRIPWSYNDYYNGFELQVGTPVQRAGGKTTFHVLGRADVTEKVVKGQAGNPVITPMVVEDASFLSTLRRFLASIDSDDERRTYERMGRPDKVEALGNEVSWWYFEAGEAYRFQAGKLEKIEKFDPVRDF